MRMKEHVCGVVLLAAMAMPAEAFAAPEAYTLDGEHTHIVWQVERFGFTKTIGTFTEISGELILDDEAPENSSVTAEISVTSVRSDLPQREEIIRGEYWLDAANFPAISFQSSSVELVKSEDCPENCALVHGDMTLKGVSLPLSLTVRLNKAGTDPVTRNKAMGFTATGSFKRSAYGVTTAVGPVGDDVTFQIEALAIHIKTGTE